MGARITESIGGNFVGHLKDDARRLTLSAFVDDCRKLYQLAEVCG